MAEYIEKNNLIRWIERQKRLSKLHTILVIQDTPASDVEEVVRCKDCKRCEKAINVHAGRVFKCNLFHPNDGRRYKNPYDFCSYGERKDNA